jgi:putative nucleotidyltransferase with HDIG domain
VAHLAEAGGRAIGGDRLLLRAGAWYHDLGKLLGSGVFAENRGPGEDPQGALTPQESARRIARHVPDGLRLARRYRLPAELRALIAEHHGTSSIHGPAQRARLEGRDIDPAVYYYPGPLPSSREAAILMVSDAVEAASRRIDDPSLTAVSEVVEEVVDRLMSEYQFEDCDLTQVDLVALAEALVLTLRRTLHRRQPGPDALDPASTPPLRQEIP